MTALASLAAVGASAALVNNVVFHYFLGQCPCLGSPRRLRSALVLGLAVTAVTTLAAGLAWPAARYLLAPGAPAARWLASLVLAPHAAARADLSVLSYLVFVVLISGAVQAAEAILGRLVPAVRASLGLFLPLVAANCVVLFLCIETARHALPGSGAPWSLPHTLAHSFFSGVGFLLALVVMTTLRDQLESADVPRPFRGHAIALIVAGILALGFMGFTGVDKPYTPPPAAGPASREAPAATEPASSEPATTEPASSEPASQSQPAGEPRDE